MHNDIVKIIALQLNKNTFNSTFSFETRCCCIFWHQREKNANRITFERGHLQTAHLSMGRNNICRNTEEETRRASGLFFASPRLTACVAQNTTLWRRQRLQRLSGKQEIRVRIPLVLCAGYLMSTRKHEQS